MSPWHWGKHGKASSFLSRACQQTHYYHTQTKSHTPRWGKTTHTLARRCLPGDQRELWMLTSLPTLHVCESPQNTSHCCPSFWLPSMTPQPQTSKRPLLAASPQPDGYFLTVCGLLHLCSTTLNPRDGWVEKRGLELCMDKWYGGSRANKTD